MVSEELARELFANGQVAFQYVDAAGQPTAEAPYNPNGSSYAIEGIVSPDGRILGKMGHTERYEPNLFRNIAGNRCSRTPWPTSGRRLRRRRGRRGTAAGEADRTPEKRRRNR